MNNVKMIRVERLVSNSDYQRVVNWNWIKKTAKVFDWRLFGFVKVFCNGDGTHTVIEGQNRTTMARLLGFKEVPCEIIDQLTAKKAAKVFANSHNVRKPQYAEKFKALCFAGDKDCLEVSQTIAEAGFKIGGGARDNYIPCLKAVSIIHKNEGQEWLLKVLKLLKEMWDGDARTLKGTFVLGFSKFLKEYEEEIIIYNLITKFKTISILKILDQLQMYRNLGGGAINSYVKAFCSLYNKGKRLNRLPEKNI